MNKSKSCNAKGAILHITAISTSIDVMRAAYAK